MKALGCFPSGLLINWYSEWKASRIFTIANMHSIFFCKWRKAIGEIFLGGPVNLENQIRAQIQTKASSTSTTLTVSQQLDRFFIRKIGIFPIFFACAGIISRIITDGRIIKSTVEILRLSCTAFDAWFFSYFRQNNGWVIKQGMILVLSNAVFSWSQIISSFLETDDFGCEESTFVPILRYSEWTLYKWI